MVSPDGLELATATIWVRIHRTGHSDSKWHSPEAWNHTQVDSLAIHEEMAELKDPHCSGRMSTWMLKQTDSLQRSKALGL